MAWLLHNLCIHPEAQEKARAEADLVQDLSVESIHNIPFIEACTLETLRLNPSIPVSINRALVNCGVAGKTIRAGTQLIFPLAQMMKDNYEHGDEFRPERWLTPDGSTIDENKRSELISFGFGPRQCPGRHLAMRELLCFAVELLHTFEGFRLLEDRLCSAGGLE
ncbi:cytochrome p450, putative [Perkinsus marinus ATCC 50983]|uniref:Cytochrome p450, putative n=1 Tax=Perkinsus marinus (strain ATCC 50983 / TXsc) TaxID=423536 RepID=C5LLP2_PERM5|nr:cytochrome p450, putative [Perkinsus marinus ATCC 50983]EER02264.1 cytochrome p450, putative [Perkinsus marinus ATCC 50983]|eukprot:XP_002769546.1 cytochrome p450, putative [Perkinsus marinus ATCC 50983]